MPVGLLLIKAMLLSHNQTCPPDRTETKEKGTTFAFNAGMAGARSEELGGSTPSLLRALSGMGGTSYRRVCFKRKSLGECRWNYRAVNSRVAGSNPVVAAIYGHVAQSGRAGRFTKHLSSRGNFSGGMPVGVHRYGTVAERPLTKHLSPGP